MSFLQSGGTNATAPTVYTGLNLQTSAQGVPVTLMWGKNRVTPNIFWYNNFQSHKGNGKGGGGKGGAKGSGNYTYTAAVMLGLCEGPIDRIEAGWVDQTEYEATNGEILVKLGLTLFAGTASQPVWSYLTTNYPGQAIPYEFALLRLHLELQARLVGRAAQSQFRSRRTACLHGAAMGRG